jgi:predicted ribosome quality control (RQC) complex YloA/Tae2 family protein
MDKRCFIEACKREAETYCYHCSQDVCSNHFLEHKKWVQEQLPSLVDEVNVMYDRLHPNDKHEETSIPKCLTDAHNQLDKWCADCHYHIDIVHRRVRSQIESIVERYKDEETRKAAKNLQSLEEMRQQLTELLKEGDMTYRQLETMRRQLEEVRKKEQELSSYPDIRVITQKLDVDKHVSITVDVQQAQESMMASPLHT